MMNTYPENDSRNYLMHWGKGGERTKRIKAENATKKKDYIINAKNAKKSRKR